MELLREKGKDLDDIIHPSVLCSTYSTSILQFPKQSLTENRPNLTGCGGDSKRCCSVASREKFCRENKSGCVWSPIGNEVAERKKNSESRDAEPVKSEANDGKKY
jgi:hypothetical protein